MYIHIHVYVYIYVCMYACYRIYIQCIYNTCTCMYGRTFVFLASSLHPPDQFV